MSRSYYTLMVLVIGFYHHIFFCQILKLNLLCKIVNLSLVKVLCFSSRRIFLLFFVVFVVMDKTSEEFMTLFEEIYGRDFRLFMGSLIKYFVHA